MQVGQKYLVEQPGYIADKSEPLTRQILYPPHRYENRRGQPGHDSARDHSQGEMKEIKSSRENDPGGEADQKSEAERDYLLDADGKSVSLPFPVRGKFIW